MPSVCDLWRHRSDTAEPPEELEYSDAQSDSDLKLADDCELLLELYAAMRSLFLRLLPLLRKMSVESIITKVNQNSHLEFGFS